MKYEKMPEKPVRANDYSTLKKDSKGAVKDVKPAVPRNAINEKVRRLPARKAGRGGGR